jgi:hypothetical protein
MLALILKISLLRLLDYKSLKPQTFNKQTADGLGKFSNSLVLHS